jgi:RNA polymerase-binding transcription factor DksA
MMRFDAATLAPLRAQLMRRGQTLATMLADVLAGKRPPALASLASPKPGARPEEIVRAALEQIEARRRLIDAGDDRYGRCDVCGADLGLAALREVPGADRCAAHATR